MNRDKLNFRVILRIGFSLLPILFGMPTIAMVICAYNLAMSFVFCGPLTAFVSSLSAVCISMFFCSSYGVGAQLQGLFLAIEAILCAAACIYAVLFKKSFYPGVWLAAGGFLVPSFISLYNDAAKAGMSVAQYLTQLPLEMLRLQLESVPLELQQAGFNAVAVEKILEKVGEITVMVIPSMLILCSVVIGYIVVWSVTSQLRKLPFGIKHSFSHIRLPRSMVAVLALALILLVLGVWEELSYISANVFLVLIFLCFFAGMSFVDYYLRRIICGNFIRILIHIFVIITATTTTMISPFINIFVIYALIAVVDSFADFRKLSLEEEKRGDLDETEKRDA